MNIRKLQLSERRVKALLHCIETQRNVIDSLDESSLHMEGLDEESRKKLDVGLEYLKDDISGMTGVKEENLAGLL